MLTVRTSRCAVTGVQEGAEPGLEGGVAVELLGREAVDDHERREGPLGEVALDHLDHQLREAVHRVVDQHEPGRQPRARRRSLAGDGRRHGGVGLLGDRPLHLHGLRRGPEREGQARREDEVHQHGHERAVRHGANGRHEQAHEDDDDVNPAVPEHGVELRAPCHAGEGQDRVDRREARHRLTSSAAARRRGRWPAPWAA